MARYLEEVGYDEIVGQDGGQPVAAQQRRVVKKMPDKQRRGMLPLEPAIALAAGASFEMVAEPQSLFRPEGIVLSGDLVDFEITDIKVGNKSQNIEDGVLAAAMFAPDSTWQNGMYVFDTAQVSGKVRLIVRNTHATDPKTMRGALIGTAFTQ